MKKLFRSIPFLVTLGLLGVLLSVYFVSCAMIPDGVEGAGANRLARKMLRAVNFDAWRNNTAAVSFNFVNRHQIFWDKKRGLVEVRWRDDDQQWLVQLRHDRKFSLVRQNGRSISDPRLVLKKTATAYKYFINDTFWLNPLFHIARKGVRRYLVSANQLRVTFSDGGVTPGDTYLFTVDRNYLVTKMTMWVKIIFVKGLWARFGDYSTTETGVKLATSHKILFYNVKLTDLKMFRSYPVPGEPDRFKELLGLISAPKPSTNPTSRPVR